MVITSPLAGRGILCIILHDFDPSSLLVLLLAWTDWRPGSIIKEESVRSTASGGVEHSERNPASTKAAPQLRDACKIQARSLSLQSGGLAGSGMDKPVLLASLRPQSICWGNKFANHLLDFHTATAVHIELRRLRQTRSATLPNTRILSTLRTLESSGCS